MLPQTTLCLLLKDSEILLAMKKRGFGLGKWNGYGGKPQPDETIHDTALREMREEIGVVCRKEDLAHAASLKFYFKSKPEWNQEVIVFLIRKWDGVPEESEEMRPQWFKFEEIPFDQMWPDDRHWLPKILAGQKLDADFYFNDDNTGFDDLNIRII